MAFDKKRLKTDSQGYPVSQGYNPDIDDFEPMKVTDGSMHVKVVDGATINATLGDQQAKTVDVTLQNTVSAVGVGIPFTVNAYKTLTLEISGTSTSRTINFEGSSASGTYYPIMGVKLTDLSMATSTTGNNEVWSFDVTGLTNFRANLTAVAGGNVTVKGKAVA